ncbi:MULTISPECIES: shikimate dehydrogenase [Aneurinibacillus]|uniref:Shikimate dehydrogenase (NADP(+)) n=1 Tax=Aneurinibacillus thermoaerophilus TaxID=143495 RepID=A0A1G7Z867_ANETH|nr:MULTISPECIES: shikimate dehydrogenase [Aneurinibacillus]AMA72301.1 shikimate dehydrogenase [Aneurinibacillus sp. XH2]MED0674848.1 shikimate dehydrogenase [Aneurinibacillus thermoaerophilus]MED0679798.1 shikimate dehydrogenase [Aneurinibacillus thermoaerophilus]MED0735830.1 shikimate dehydrogenase [Aneurinibacillus thermoaerophilus]MED0758500.1 shikimate dehydrogenase [Aneurinibacillus thermoaerophilus]
MDSQTILTGLFGHPVGHSLSPLMHNRAFEACGLNYRYAAFDIDPSRVQEAVQAVRALGMRGVNVTIPYKVTVMDYLDEVDEEAKIIGAVNTIVNEGGKLVGYNTDGRGYVRSLTEETGIDLASQSAVLLGAGGAARGVAIALLKAGLPSLVIANRTVEKAEQLAAHMKQAVPQATVCALPLNKVAEALATSTLLIQTTSIGMHPKTEASPLPAETLHGGLTVSDLIYNPMETRLLRDAKAKGARVHCGVGMFIYQGALSFEYWTGRPAPVNVMREVVMDALRGQ